METRHICVQKPQHAYVHSTLDVHINTHLNTHKWAYQRTPFDSLSAQKIQVILHSYVNMFPTSWDGFMMVLIWLLWCQFIEATSYSC